MQTLAKVAGAQHVLHIQLGEEHLKYLHMLPRLEVLRIMYDPRDWPADPEQEVDVSFLSSLPLRVLDISVSLSGSLYCYRLVLFTGFSALARLAGVHLLNGLAVDLPVSVTELTVTIDLPDSGLEELPDYFFSPIARFRCWISTFHGHLSKVALDMRPFESDPAALQLPDHGASCLRHASDVRLAFSPGHGTPSSPQWCCGFFTQLQTLHLQFDDVAAPFCPVWDLSTCSLRVLRISINVRHPKRLCFTHITGVTADTFELHFLCARRDISPRFNFTSWTLARANIYSWWRDCKGMPACVLATLGALQCSSVVPAITINGLTPAEAAADFEVDPPQDWDASSSDTSDPDE